MKAITRNARNGYALTAALLHKKIPNNHELIRNNFLFTDDLMVKKIN